MTATSLSTKSCPTGYCGQCGPCRREMREADRLMIPKVQAPIELSPTVQQLLAEERKRERRTRRPIAKVQNRRKPTTPPKPTTTNCANCGQHRALHNRGMGKVLDGHGNLCAVCHDTPQYQARLKQLQNTTTQRSQLPPRRPPPTPPRTHHPQRTPLPPQRTTRHTHRIHQLRMPLPPMRPSTRPTRQSTPMTHTLTIPNRTPIPTADLQLAAYIRNGVAA